MLLKPGMRLHVKSQWSGGYMVGDCVMNSDEEIKCIHGWFHWSWYLSLNGLGHAVFLLDDIDLFNQ